MKLQRGFTLIELMIVVLVIGILAAIVIPSLVSFQVRAREAGVKSNMHAFQIAAEDYRITYDTTYAWVADDVAPLVTGTFLNPFDKSAGANNAWEDRASMSALPTSKKGLTSYADSSSGMTYNVKGYGGTAALALILSSGY